MSLRRIDTHTHVVPPRFKQWLTTELDFKGPMPDWSAASALAFFDSVGTETGILSISNPGMPVEVPARRRRAEARAANEFCADVVRETPDRFGFFAVLLLPDVEGSIAEAEYALDELRADGVMVLTHAGADYLGAPEWDPLLELLSEREAVLYVHPTSLPGPMVPGGAPGTVDFLADTSRAAANLAKHGCLTRFPGIKVLLSHGGGYVPYAATRIASMASREADEEQILAQLRRLYFDSALIGGPYALPSLLAFADHEHLTFGSDWPFEFRDRQSSRFTERLDEALAGNPIAPALYRGNAEKLFPRLAGTAGAD